ncbi:MAG: polyketide synthase dehydratase domain-containing protein [Desulfocapsaceae bacterium]|nr:polyketide synthase dehydratase domain-containing protein [Desulfocapsaceae bacterium]
MMARQQPVAITVQPWFRDHCFNGKVILPAVETMEIMAAAVKESGTDALLSGMYDAGFSKFLEIPAGATELSALVEYDEEDEGEIGVKLLSRTCYKKITRLKEHARIKFSTRPQNRGETVPIDQLFPTQPTGSVAAKHIYEELVPFGPCYHTLTGHLHLSNLAAWGILQAPNFLQGQEEMAKNLGSPFPLDGAMHAACVLGQTISDFVPFPVGFAERIIHRPTKAGAQYSTTVVLVSQDSGELVFDLSIFDAAGKPCETVKGLKMRDVSGGQIKPPEWIKRYRFLVSG